MLKPRKKKIFFFTLSMNYVYNILNIITTHSKTFLYEIFSYEIRLKIASHMDLGDQHMPAYVYM